MLQNYLITAWRNIRKSRSFTLINILGLALGMAVCILVLQYVIFELSYDSFHQKHDRIVRLGLQYNWDEGGFKIALNTPSVIQFKDDFPEVEEFTRLRSIQTTVASYGAIVSYEPPMGQPVHRREKRIYYADSTLFDVFDFKLIQGNPSQVLRKKNTLLITESVARKWFGQKNPLGEVLTFNYDEPYVIEGVLADLPAASHIQFDYLLSYMSLGMEGDESGFSFVYFLLKPDTNLKAFEEKANLEFHKYRDIINPLVGWWGHFIVQPLDEVHLTTDYHYESDPTQSKEKLYALALVGLLILVMAWINYINLSTARAINRNREVGVRKVAGALRKQLIQQFLMESVMMNALAFFLALVLVVLSQEFMRELTGWASASVLWQEPRFWLFLLVTFVLGSLCSGLYPAFVLSAFNPVKVLKGNPMTLAGGQYIRKSLVVFQFATSVALIIGTFIIYKQLTYLRSMDLVGFDIEEIFVVKVPVEEKESHLVRAHQIFREKVLALSGIKQFTATESVPGDVGNIGQVILYDTYDPNNEANNKYIGLDGGVVDYNYLDFYGLELLAGRFFRQDLTADTTALVLSESAARRMGYRTPEAALNEKVLVKGNDHNREAYIIGVVKDYNLLAPNVRKENDNLAPGRRGIALRLGDNPYLSSHYRYYNLKVNMQNWPHLQAALEQIYKEVYPDRAYESFFLNDFFNRQYQADLQFSNIFIFFALQAILIACLGLFGLTAFLVERKNKEIGIRKALGAASIQIWLLLVKDIAKGLILASVIAIPVINYFMSSWLQQFTYQISIRWWMFIFPVALMTVIALLTISQHLNKAAKLNPVKLLRYE